MHDTPGMEVPQGLGNLLGYMDALVHKEGFRPPVDGLVEGLSPTETVEREERGEGERKGI